MRRSYADAAASAAAAPASPSMPASPPSTAGPVKVAEQIAQVTSRLMGATLPQPAVPTPQVQVVMPVATAQPTSAQLRAEIKQLEASAAGLQGDGVKISRDSVLAQIAEKKRLIIETQPIGQRLDGARAVLERSRKRRVQAEETLLLAQKALQDASAEESKLSAELAELETMAGPGGQQPMESDDAVQSLKGHLTSVLQHLNDGQCVDPALILVAETHSAQLLEGFRVTLEQAAKAKEQGDEPTHRIRGKSAAPRRSCVTPGKVVRMRMAGKQARKFRRLGGFFGADASQPLGGAPSEGRSSSGSNINSTAPP